MKIIVTGANGYIGKRLIPVLLDQGHTLYCCVRDQARFKSANRHLNLHIVEIDFLSNRGSQDFPHEVDVAFYLIHSMKRCVGSFADAESRASKNFVELLESTTCRQIIYLSGIVNEEKLSPHLSSRLAVEKILRKSRIPTTILRAGIIVGSGGASFEIIRDLVEKLPLMVAPRWLQTKCQPIAICNVIEFLTGVILRSSTFDQDFDIGGPEVLTYRALLYQYAEVRGLKRLILTVPVMTPRLSSYWLYFITSTSYVLARNLVDSMKVNIVGRKNNLARELGIHLLTYKESVKLALDNIEQSNGFSSWKASFSSSGAKPNLMNFRQVPQHGCFQDVCIRNIQGKTETIWERIWNIGGDHGWYYANKLWEGRGWLDKLVGGVGLNRGRTRIHDIEVGDALDFWRVLIADKENKRLLLFAEMKVPGEAWLEFKVVSTKNGDELVQTATFRPRGLFGRLYWYALFPVHHFIFKGMIRGITK